MNQKNVYSSDRMILKDVLPLSLPLCLSFEASNLCNFKCLMCYHGNNEQAEEAKPLANMAEDVFDRTLEQVKNWVNRVGNKIKLIKLYSLGEPLMNKNIVDMIKHIKDADVCDAIEITTNGSLLTKEISDRIIDSELDIIRFSIYGVYNDSNMRVTQTSVLPKDIYENIAYLSKKKKNLKVNHPLIIVKMFKTNTEEDNAFLNMYSEIADVIGFDEVFNLSSGNVDVFQNMYLDKSEEMHTMSLATNISNNRKACRYPFTHMTVKNNGTVVVCCNDWLKELSFGNIFSSTLEELWNSEELYSIRKNMLDTKGLCFSACKCCEIPFRDYPEDEVDDVDINQFRIKMSR